MGSPVIGNLPIREDVVGTDTLAIDIGSASGPYQAMVSALLTYMQNHLVFSTASGVQLKVVQNSSPSASDFTVVLVDSSDNAWLQLAPLAGYSSGTLTLPSVATAIANQEILVTSTQAVAGLTIDINGATAIRGEPTSIIADGRFLLKFDGPTRTWYRA